MRLVGPLVYCAAASSAVTLLAWLGGSERFLFPGVLLTFLLDGYTGGFVGLSAGTPRWWAEGAAVIGSILVYAFVLYLPYWICRWCVRSWRRARGSASP